MIYLSLQILLSHPHAHLLLPLQISFVGLTQDAAEELAKEKNFKLGISKTSFKANSKVCFSCRFMYIFERECVLWVCVCVSFCSSPHT
jgi:hypothetical protein